MTSPKAGCCFGGDTMSNSVSVRQSERGRGVILPAAPLGSPYRFGRLNDWLKIENPPVPGDEMRRKRIEAPSAGRRDGALGWFERDDTMPREMPPTQVRV